MGEREREQGLQLNTDPSWGPGSHLGVAWQGLELWCGTLGAYPSANSLSLSLCLCFLGINPNHLMQTLHH
jgi:hypothetical protein